MKKQEKQVITQEIRGLYSDILIWFLSDNINIDKNRLKRLFNGRIERIKDRIS